MFCVLGRVDAIDALDEMEELEDFDDLKTKILYSVIVLAYRASQRAIESLKSTVRNQLQLPDTAGLDGEEDEPLNAASLVVGKMEETAIATSRDRRWISLAKNVEDTIGDWLRKTALVFNLTCCLEDVEEQLHATLYDFPSLKECALLREFIVSAIRVAW